VDVPSLQNENTTNPTQPNPPVTAPLPPIAYIPSRPVKTDRRKKQPKKYTGRVIGSTRQRPGHERFWWFDSYNHDINRRAAASASCITWDQEIRRTTERRSGVLDRRAPPNRGQHVRCCDRCWCSGPSPPTRSDVAARGLRARRWQRRRRLLAAAGRAKTIVTLSRLCRCCC
jgi:hypothetical protein